MNANNVESVLARQEIKETWKSTYVEKRSKRKPIGKSFHNRRSVRKHEKAQEGSSSSNQDEGETYRPCTFQDHSSNQGVKYSCWLCQEELSSEEVLLAHYQNHMTFTIQYNTIQYNTIQYNILYLTKVT